MHYNNNASLVKRELLVSLIKLMLEDKLDEGIDRIPYQLSSGPGYEPIRCCVFHDRVILKIRILARLGFSVEGYEDDGTSLGVYAKKALERDHVEGPFLTVLDEACNACIRSQYMVTNACQGCLARPCLLNCPKKAVSMTGNHARIKAWSEGKNTGNILEVMACPGGCAYGPLVIANPRVATNQLKKIAEESEG